MAIEAAEASFVPDAVFAQHLFGLVHGVAAPGASLAILRLRSVRGLHVGAAKGKRTNAKQHVNGWRNAWHCLAWYLLHWSSLGVGGDKRWRVAETETLRAEQLAVAGATVDLAVRTVAGNHGIERPVTFVTVEALLVPHRSLGQLLLGGEHHAAASWATLSLRRLDHGRVNRHHRLLRGQLLLTRKERAQYITKRKTSSLYRR